METSAVPLDLRRIVRKGWKIALAITLICAGVALLLHALWPARYEATAVLTVAPISSSPAGDGVNMDTERVVSSSDSVLREAAELTDKSITKLRDNLLVSIPKGSNVLKFTVTSTDPEEAAQAANAISEAYGLQRTKTAQDAVDRATASLTTRIAELEAELGRQPEESIRSRAIELQIASLQERQAVLSASTFYPGSIVSVAVPPTGSTTPSFYIFLVGGLFLGLIIGAFVALVAERLRLQRAE